MADAVIGLIPEYLVADRAGGRHITFHLGLRGGPTYELQIDDDVARVSQGDVVVCDWRISADPATFLFVGSGRMSAARGLHRHGRLGSSRVVGACVRRVVESP